MSKAARAIIIHKEKILVMHRDKYGVKYFTLVGGRLNEGETLDQALIREIKEETGLNIVKSRLVFIEEHAAPYNEQYIYLCDIDGDSSVALQDSSEEAMLNNLGLTTHRPMWVDIKSFSTLPFRTIQLQEAILNSLKNGFPDKPQNI